MAQAFNSLSPFEQALQLVKAAGYRVTKPKPRKLTSRGPTCVVRFADGVLCRMTTHCRDDALDYELGFIFVRQRGVRGKRCQWSKLRKLCRRTSNVMGMSLGKERQRNE